MVTKSFSVAGRGHKIFLRRWPWSQNLSPSLAVVTKSFCRRCPWSQNLPPSLAVVTKSSFVAGRGHKIFCRRWPWSQNLLPSLAVVTKSSFVAGRGHKIFCRRWPLSPNLPSSPAVLTLVFHEYFAHQICSSSPDGSDCLALLWGIAQQLLLPPWFCYCSENKYFLCWVLAFLCPTLPFVNFASRLYCALLRSKFFLSCRFSST